jgi:hypothetical protein
MEKLQQQIRKARRRLTLQEFWRVLPRFLCLTLGLVGSAIIFDLYRPLGLIREAWLAGAVVTGLLLSVAWSFWRRRGPLEAAIELDQRYGLRERVSSALSLAPAELESPMGQALLADATRRIERIDVAERFRIRPWDRLTPLPLIPILLTALALLFLNPQSAQQQAEASTAKRQIKTSTEQLRKQLAQRRKEAEARGLKDSEQLFQKLEEAAEELTRAENLDRKDALVKLNDVMKELQERKENLGGNQAKDPFQQLKNLQPGPGDKLAQSLNQGDFKQAMNELANLREQIAQGKLTQEQVDALVKQMQQMRDKLAQAAEAQRKQEQELEREIAQKESAGEHQEADKLREKLAQLKQQSKQAERAERLAQQLGECAKCLGEGDAEQAQQQLSSMEGELSELAQQMDELESLETALAELAGAKDSMQCKACQGEGCAECNGRGRGQGKSQGRGIGDGRGQGERADDPIETGAYDTRVRQKLGRGPATITDMVSGPNIKGQVQQEINAQVEAAQSAETDPLIEQPLPRASREHVQRYFESLREGK